MPPQTNPNDKQPVADAKDFSKIAAQVAEKISSAENILVALSQDPSIDEISAALATTLLLDGMGKHVTAIYSGTTPNILAFLKPEETFEKDTNSLQDFIIALNKNKADHLRYNIEGDYVKVYITPYRTDLSEKDLEFSRGDFNVNLVIAFDVQSGADLDGALTEYGRIMHDATAINISTEHSGRFAELEWYEPSASSVCELISILAEQLKVETLSSEVATALLTGIVAATDRFSNQHTSPNAMSIAAKLMAAGADQQLISAKILDQAKTPEISTVPPEETKNQPSEGKIDINHAPLDVKPVDMTPAPTSPTPLEAQSVEPQSQPTESQPQFQPQPQPQFQTQPQPQSQPTPAPILPMPDASAMPPMPPLAPPLDITPQPAQPTQSQLPPDLNITQPPTADPTAFQIPPNLF